MLEIQNLCKKFSAVTAVEDVTFQVDDGQICVLLGPSGCGKTTTLKMINRLIEPTSGKIRIGGRDTSEMDTVTLRRSIGYVIQQVGLFPNMTVEENICVVPDLLGWDRAKSRRRAAELLEIVALDPALFLKRFPFQLSGGQQQRVGVVRALAADPPVLLMDEPFGAIDPINREVIQDEFLKIQRKLGTIVLFVSHDIDEAVKMADCVALFHAGHIEQFGSPDDLLARPKSQVVADFMGGDRIIKRLQLLTAGTVVRGLSAPEKERLGAAKGEPLRVVESDDLRHVLSLFLTRRTDVAECRAKDGQHLGYVTQADILSRLSDSEQRVVRQ